MKRQLIMGVSFIFLVLSCSTHSENPPSTKELINILEQPESEELVEAIRQLEKMEPEQIEPASLALGRVLQYQRHDSTLAAAILMKLGPRGKEAIPELVRALENNRVEVRGYAAIVLGMIGKDAQCAVPQLAQHLWDNGAIVRGSAARALDAITGIDLVWETRKLDDQTDFTSSLVPDNIIADQIPFSKKAQDWWIGEGQYNDWSQQSSYCQPE